MLFPAPLIKPGDQRPAAGAIRKGAFRAAGLAAAARAICWRQAWLSQPAGRSILLRQSSHWVLDRRTDRASGSIQLTPLRETDHRGPASAEDNDEYRVESSRDHRAAPQVDVR